jgi:hypothetical protein
MAAFIDRLARRNEPGLRIGGASGERGRDARKRGAGEMNQLPGAPNLICMVFHNLMPDAATTQYALQSTRQFFNQPLRAGSYVGVFRLDQRLVVLQPFTDDRAALLRAAQDGFAAAPTEFARVAEAVPDAGPIAVTPGEASSPAHDEQRGGIVGSAARGTASAGPVLTPSA